MTIFYIKHNMEEFEVFDGEKWIDLVSTPIFELAPEVIKLSCSCVTKLDDGYYDIYLLRYYHCQTGEEMHEILRKVK